MSKQEPLTLPIPGGPLITVAYVMMDFTGTLSCDGVLLPGVAERIRAVRERARLIVATADTFGKAHSALEGLPVDLRFVEAGDDKLELLMALGPHEVAAIGNGRNDVGMVRDAALGIAVLGSEGTCGDLLTVADVVVRDIRDALDLLLRPQRLSATMRP